MHLDGTFPCSVKGCPNTSDYQTAIEAKHGVVLCDPSGSKTPEESHFLAFMRAEDRAAWVAENTDA